MAIKQEFKSQINFQELFTVKEVICYIDPELFKTYETYTLVTFKSEPGIDLYMIVENVLQKVTRCFVKLWTILRLNNIEMANPIFYTLTDSEYIETINSLETSSELLEVHWLKNKTRLLPLVMNNGFPDLVEMTKIGENFQSSVPKDTRKRK